MKRVLLQPRYKRLFCAIANNNNNNSNTVKALRELTGAPIMDCKVALKETHGDFEKAKAWIVEKSKIVAQKISNRSAKEGLIGLAIDEQNVAGALVEVNCETDFVARNKDFQNLVKEQAMGVLEGKELPKQVVEIVAGKVRENIVLGPSVKLSSSHDNSVLGTYLHNRLGDDAGTTGAIVSVQFSDASKKEEAQKLAKMLAIQIVGSKPKYLNRSDIPPQVRQVEEARIAEDSKDILKAKPEKKQDIIKGKMQKFYGECCLLDQAIVIGEMEGKLVKDVLGKTFQIQGFIRMALGGDFMKA